MFVNNTGGFLLQTMLYLSNHTENARKSSLEGFKLSAIGADMDLRQPKCYGVYGCFPLTPPWTTETRPVSLYPESPGKINVRYPVFTKNSRSIPVYLDLNEPALTRNAGIDPKGHIYFIAHGYIESGNRPWIQQMANAILDHDKKGTATVVVVDWGGGSSPPYTQAVANIRLVGAITAHIIHMIYEELRLMNLDNVHILGHSLGAHLCGYAGFTLQRDFGLTVGRITGMDPAEPLFTDTDPLVRLDQTDARFVDIVHTDAQPFSSGGLGMRKAIGHVDFYPNGGYNNPGCDAPMQDYIVLEKGSFFWGVQQFISCNHIRSHQYMTDSIQTHCPFMAISCETYEDFKAGHCFECGANGHQCLQFGFNAFESYRGLMSSGLIHGSQPIRAYLMTDGRKPFCRTHYRVTLAVSYSDESRIHGGEIGIMSIIVQSHHNSETERMVFSHEPEYYEPGANYTSVMPGKDVGIPKMAKLNWEYKANPLNPLTWRIMASPRVYISYIIVESMEHKSRLKLCPVFDYPVIADSQTVFTHENCNELPNELESVEA